MARRVGLVVRIVRAMMTALMAASIASVFRPSPALGVPSLESQSVTTYQDYGALELRRKGGSAPEVLAELERSRCASGER